MNKATIISLIAIILTALSASAADNASKILEQTANKVRSAQSISANYTLTSPGSGSTSGTLTLAGDKFVMTSPQMTIWYDGKTQWTYIPADNEVNISEPTAEELQQVNPFVIINSFRETYAAKNVANTKTSKKIRLTAKNAKADIRSALVTINASTMLPDEISLTMASGQTASIIITSATTGKALPATTFQFPTKKYPKAYVVDLR